MTIRYLAAVAALAVPLAGLAQIALTGDEITAWVSDRKLSTQNTQFGSVGLDFRSGGRLYGANNGGTDSGTWKVVDGKLCLEWRKWDYAGCGEVRRVGAEVQHLWPDGRVHFVVR